MSISFGGHVRGYDLGAAVFDAIGNPKSRRRKRKGGRGGSYPTGMRREFFFDMDYLGFAMQMYNQIPGAQFARRAMQARTFCGEFIVEFQNWPGANGNESRQFGEESQDVVRRHWMPFLKEMYDFKEVWGFCPYVWEHIEGTQHYYPRVPPWGTYMLSYEEDRYGRTFRLYWVDDIRPEEAQDVFWVRTDQEPQMGRLRTAISSLMPEYELYLVNMGCTKDAAINRANPYHIYEYKPQVSGDLSEIQDTQIMLGKNAALAALRDQEESRNSRDGIRRDYLIHALQSTYEQNYGHGWPDTGPQDADQLDLQDTHGKFLQRSVMLNADYQYKAAQQSDVVMKMEEIWRKLNQDAANALGFPLEFAQAQSAQRAANVQGNTRYINENVKELIRSYTDIVERMWLVSPYGRVVHRLNALKRKAATEAREQRLARRVAEEKEDTVVPAERSRRGEKNKDKKKKRKRKKTGAEAAEGPEFKVPRVRSIREPSQRMEHELRQQIDVKIKFSCVPEMTYEQLRELVLDQVIGHGDFVKLAGDIFGMPRDILSSKRNGKLMEQEQMDISRKDAQQKWRHQDEALKWHEHRMELMSQGQGGEGGGAGGANAQPPKPQGAAIPPPARASRPADRRKSSSSSSAVGAN